MEERLNKRLARCGFSRREADRLIEAGRVTVNGQAAELGMRVTQDAVIAVDDNAVVEERRMVYIALNKPYGVITTSDTKSRDTVMSLVPSSPRLFPVGRLDVRSTGLLLMTNDGELADRLTHPKYGHEKEYLVGVEDAINDDALDALRTGVKLEDGDTSPAVVRRIADNVFVITLTEGRNKQVRRMCEAVGHKVKTLRRTRIGPLLLGDIEAGKWRMLSEDEVATLRAQRSKKIRRSDEGWWRRD